MNIVITNRMNDNEMEIAYGGMVFCGTASGDPNKPGILKEWEDLDAATQERLKEIGLKAEALMDEVRLCLGVKALVFGS